MQRKRRNKLWKLILMLTLCGAALLPVGVVRAGGTTPVDPLPLPGAPPDPGTGDPDSPDTGKSLPKPGPIHGKAGQVPQKQDAFSVWMRLRMIFASVYRMLFRF